MEHCPVANMDEFSREFIGLCHAHNPSAPCMYVYCGRNFEWHVREGVYNGLLLASEEGHNNSTGPSRHRVKGEHLDSTVKS